jgi:hypothetical protein
MTRLASILFVAALVVPLVASAAPSFQPLPPQGDHATALQIRVVRYTGGVHGKMIIEVRNRGAREEGFSARGLYFVPAVAPERAPQREGAAGAFEVASLPSRPKAASISLRPGQTARLDLQTFCLDSHRPSPRPGQAYRVASRRLPAVLERGIESGAASILESGGDAGAIQQLVWTTRNQRWIVLEGERRGERDEAPQAPASQPAGQEGLHNL